MTSTPGDGEGEGGEDPGHRAGGGGGGPDHHHSSVGRGFTARTRLTHGASHAGHVTSAWSVADDREF